MNYAIIKLSDNQYKITKGQTIKVNRLEKFEPKVLMASIDGAVKLGNPYLEGVNIKANIEREEKGEKITIRRFKAKSRYHKTRGFRQTLSVVTITDIFEGEEKPKRAKKEEVKELEAEVKPEVKTEKTEKKVSKPRVKKEAK
jgi:large subunit ribosomal protein L21